MSLFRKTSGFTPPQPSRRQVSTRKVPSTRFVKTPSQHPLSTPKRQPFEPNSARFVIKSVAEYRKVTATGNYLLVVINYPDCTNFEGNKILVFENLSERELKLMRNIDPHFFNDSRYKTPIARFEPSRNGMRAAKDFCDMMARRN